MLEEALVVVPWLLCRGFPEPRQIVGIGDRLPAAALRGFGQQGKIQSLDWFAAFRGQLRADAPFVFQARDFVAAGTTKVTNPLFAFFLQLRIVHKGGLRIGGRLLLFQSDKISGDIFRVLWRKTETR